MSVDSGSLFQWQDKALDAWLKAGGRGIVEGMTGTGKTHVAFKAIQRLLDQGVRVSPLIVVPTRALLDQWIEKLQREFPGRIFGRMGDGSHDTFARASAGALPLALVSTIHSAVPAVENGLFQHCDRGGGKSFLIADECHRYLNEDQKLYNRIVRARYDYTLGLSATIEPWKVEGLGEIVYSYNINQAVIDGVIPKFDAVNVGVSLSGEELNRYLELSERAKSIQSRLRVAYPELEAMEGDEYWRHLRHLKLEEAGDDGPVTQLFLTYYKRAAISYEAGAKLKLVPQIIDRLVSKAHKKVLVFFERIWTAEFGQDDLVERVAKRIKHQLCGSPNDPVDDPIWCKLYHSKIPDKERAKVMEEFRSIGPSALLACRSLDEGLDVPAVDAAILVASTQSARQRLQRIGRTLRRGDGKKKPLIVILYVKGTSDSNVAISPKDKDFQDAATVYGSDAKDALTVIAERLDPSSTQSPSTAPPPPLKPPAAKAPAADDSIDPNLYTWEERTAPAMGRGRIETTLRSGTSPGAVVRIELTSGKQITGTLIGVAGDSVLLKRPNHSCDVSRVCRIWLGSPKN